MRAARLVVAKGVRAGRCVGGQGMVILNLGSRIQNSFVSYVIIRNIAVIHKGFLKVDNGSFCMRSVSTSNKHCVLSI